MEPLAPSSHRLSPPADELPPPVTRPRLRLVLPRCMDLHDVGSDQRAWPQRWGEGSLLPSQGRTERTVRPPPSPLMSTKAGPPVARAEVNPRRLNEIVTSMAGLRTTVTRYDVRGKISAKSGGTRLVGGPLVLLKPALERLLMSSSVSSGAGRRTNHKPNKPHKSALPGARAQCLYKFLRQISMNSSF